MGAFLQVKKIRCGWFHKGSACASALPWLPYLKLLWKSVT